MYDNAKYAYFSNHENVTRIFEVPPPHTHSVKVSKSSLEETNDSYFYHGLIRKYPKTSENLCSENFSKPFKIDETPKRWNALAEIAGVLHKPRRHKEEKKFKVAPLWPVCIGTQFDSLEPRG